MLAGFTCGPCQEAASASGAAIAGAGAIPPTRSTRDCPSCGITVDKDGGCNYCSCNCGAHWCWECRFEATGDDIYHHMIREHGGIDEEDEQEL